MIGFRYWAEAHPDHVSVVDARGRRATYGALAEDVNRCSHGLRAIAAVEPGDTIACVLPNTIEFLTLYLAAMQSGVYLVTINYHLTAGEIRYILEDSGACALVTARRFADAAEEAAQGLGIRRFVVDANPERDSWRELVDGQSPSLPRKRPAGAVMLYTSGTTGRPKGVKRPLAGLHADAGARTYAWLFDELGLGAAVESWLVAAPMYHGGNLTPAAGALHLGGKAVLMEGWTAQLFLEAVARESVVGTHLVPTQFRRLLAVSPDRRADYDVSSLRYVLHGAAPCPVELKRRMFDWLGPVLYEYYGSTEVGTTIARPDEWLAHPGTVGRPSSISELRILDEKGRELPPYETGLVYMRQGDDEMQYHNDPEKTAAARRGRLVTVGDMGYVDDDGYLFLNGRAHDLIISGGVNIYPAEIESVLLAHPWVADAGVVGMPDDDLGEVPVAYVEPAPGAPAASQLVEALRAHCTSGLGRQKHPVLYRVAATLPRDPNGKLYKHRLA